MTNLLWAVVACLVNIESGGDPKALGDYKNGEPRAVGILQQWTCSVDEANRIAGRKLWVYEDRLEPMKAKAMAFTTLRFHYLRGVTDPIELGCKWNTPYGKVSEKYRNKVRKEWERHER